MKLLKLSAALFASTFSIAVQAQIYLAENGLTVSGTGTSKKVYFGGTLLNAQTPIDFGSSNTSSNFLMKKGTSNYFFIANNGFTGIGTASPNNRFEIDNTTVNTSGLRFTRLTSASPGGTGNGRLLSVNASGDVILVNDGASTTQSPNVVFAGPASGSTATLPSFRTLAALDIPVLDMAKIATGNLALSRIGNLNTGRLVGRSTAGTGSAEEITIGTGLNLTAGVLSQLGGSSQWATSGTTISYSNGNVGIGTASPSSPLTVANSDVSSYVPIAEFYAANNTTAGNASQIRFGQSGSSNNAAEWRYVHQGDGSTLNRTDFGYLGNATPVFSYLANGNIGIGTTSPTERLEVNGNIRLSAAYPMIMGPESHAMSLSFPNSEAKIGRLDRHWFSVTENSDLSTGYYSFGHSGNTYVKWHIDAIGVLAQRNGASAQEYRIYNTSATTNEYASLGWINNSNVFGIETEQTAGGGVRNIALLGGNVGIGTSTPQSKLAVNGTITTTKLKVTQTGWPDYVFEKTYKLPTLKEVEEYIKKHKHLPGIVSAKDVENDGLDVGENQAALLKKIEEMTLYMIDMKKQLDTQQKQILLLEGRLQNK